MYEEKENTYFQLGLLLYRKHGSSLMTYFAS